MEVQGKRDGGATKKWKHTERSEVEEKEMSKSENFEMIKWEMKLKGIK